MTRFTPIYLFIYFWLKQWACLVTTKWGKSEKQEIFCGKCWHIHSFIVNYMSKHSSLFDWSSVTTISTEFLPFQISGLNLECGDFWNVRLCVSLCLSHQLAYFSYSVLFFSILSSDVCESISIPLVQILSPLTKLFCWLHLSRRRQAVGLRFWSGRFLLVKF